MGGGLLQLVAYGAQDVYLTSSPQITYFKIVYRRHTNFSMEAIEQSFNGTPGFGKRVTVNISRNGDLIHRVYLQSTLPTPPSATDATTGTTAATGDYIVNPGLGLIDYVELEIGGQKIDKIYGDWLYIWNELTLPAGKKEGFDEMVGRYLGATTATGASSNSTGINVYTPLEFFFCRNPGLALPLIALQYHDVKLNIQFETKANMFEQGRAPASFATNSPTDLQSRCFVDYIFLDSEERRRFAQLSHELLVEQLQYTGAESVSAKGVSVNGFDKIKLAFNHPVKFLAWVVNRSGSVSKFDYSDGTYSAIPGTLLSADSGVMPNATPISNRITNLANPITSAKLQLNGHDRFVEREGMYFTHVQQFQHFDNIVPAARCPGINVYSFALSPAEHQPSGTLNMSRIDTAYLLVNSSVAGQIKIFAVNYNVLRVMSGMGGLAYSN